MTNGWVDIKNADVILCMGGNPAENHPCGFKWAIEARKTRNAKIIAVDPRFTRTAAVADVYSPLRAGTDIAYLLGIIRYAIDKKRYHEDYVKAHTNAPYVVSDKYSFNDGLFSGWDAGKGDYDKAAWAYEADAKTKAYSVDETLENPRCVFQLLKKHVDRYTPEMVERICGCPKETFLKVAELVTSTGNAPKVGTIMYALGWTQHSIGVQIIRTAAMLQLLLGNVGRPGGGVNALRGHSNIQGATDMGGTFEILPGYLKTPTSAMTNLKEYLEQATPTTLNKQAWASMNYWQNYPKFMVSYLKAVYGKAATKENDFGYAWLPKVDGNYSWMYMFDDAYRANSKRAGGTEPGPEGLLTFGMNPVGIGPNVPKIIAALSKLKWLVVVENVDTETATFWKAPKEYGGADPSKIDTEVYPPAGSQLRREGRLLHELRPLGPVEVEGARSAGTGEDRPGDHREARPGGARPLQEGERPSSRAGPERRVELHEPRSSRSRRGSEGGQREGPVGHLRPEGQDEGSQDRRSAGGRLRPAPGRRLDDVRQLALRRLLHRGGEQHAAPQQCRPAADSGCSTTGPSRGRRTGVSCTTGPPPTRTEIPGIRARSGIKWNGEKWVGDVPDMKPDAPPGTFGAFIMLPEGVGRLYAPVLNDGPFPEHYEAIEPAVDNALHPKVSSNPASKKFSSDKDLYGKKEEYPVVCTTYRLTEHFHYWTQHNPRLNELVPDFFFEVPEDFAKEKGIANESMIKVSNPRGSITAKALVTKRLFPLKVDGKPMWQIGMPIHWGYAGNPGHTGPLANFLTPSAMDANTYTPEYKTFLVKVEKA